jgi:hypothetical protein
MSSDNDKEKVLGHMAERADQCRRLGKSINDDRARDILLQMAEEIEADMRRLRDGEEPGDTGAS